MVVTDNLFYVILSDLCNRFVGVKKKAPQNNGKSKKKRAEF